MTATAAFFLQSWCILLHFCSYGIQYHYPYDACLGARSHYSILLLENFQCFSLKENNIFAFMSDGALEISEKPFTTILVKEHKRSRG